jgi:hypothetical protein
MGSTEYPVAVLGRRSTGGHDTLFDCLAVKFIGVFLYAQVF